ncbi:MAG: HAD family hydrolase [Bacillota bacterium]|jgi:phosphoglycolate phosphatase
MRVKTVLFDLDGTLWAPHSVVLPAYRRVFDQLGLPLPDEDTLLDTLGYQNDQIWRRLLPEADSATRERADRLMEQAEHDLLLAGHGEPFPGVRGTLAALVEAGCSLYVLSNCGAKYLHTVPECLGIDTYLQDRFCAGDFPGLSKQQILSTVLPQLQLPAAMVGDRWHDIAAGKGNGLLTIGCRFGMGDEQELSQADHLIDQFSDLLKVLAAV